MRLPLALLLAAFSFSVPAQAEDGPVIDQEVVTITGETVNLSDYRGQVLLIVNTASACGYTPQLAGLQQLQEQYGEQGFTVLGFPCNDFGGQSPGNSEEIAAFCSNEYGVDFPLFERVSITGDAPHPLYAALQNETAVGIAGAVRWNFTKFLVDAEGDVLARFESAVAPLSAELTSAIESALN
ncbi:MAG: glutathione peroxidase [Bradymonadia bacterium]|jgi:glutathione peroxidase